MKHVEGWNLTKLIDREYKIYVRHFARAKVACMKDDMKPCIRENDADHIMLHVVPYELRFESSPERKTKLVTGVAKK